MKKLSIFIGTLSLIGAAAHAQCTIDTQCKGDRICDKGVCAAPSSGRGDFGASPPKVPLENPVALAMEDQLKCGGIPQPGKALRALQVNGYIGAKPFVTSDGMPVFRVVKPLAVFGYKVIEVTGWQTADPMFSRGPGTAPPTTMAAVVEGDPKAIEGELTKRFGKAMFFAKASYSGYTQSATEISCYK